MSDEPEVVSERRENVLVLRINRPEARNALNAAVMAGVCAGIADYTGVDVTLGKTGYNPYRTSHFENIKPWTDAGLSEAAATNYLGAIKASLQNKNMVLDMRIPQTKRYEQDVLDTAVSQYLAKELDAAGAEQAIADGWNAITDEVGKDKQLAAYVASLGVQR